MSATTSPYLKTLRDYPKMETVEPPAHAVTRSTIMARS